ncbi:Na+/H+ antiporter NhaA [Pseudoxanthomonas kalamensis DSM 18571]|uniref:Na+/H+ antiporter NhaA n=1 Tax=Pseudoxanthomonas kalamensis TaxID=289483 RepID=UPI001391A1BE|nr:Na+/H+ antiporter NhaA [Pseudoxanthomonas kalamensis]KAF1708947.1 Na+/H+ antiporter NhaA [Pseudoxanthomonas kalamensis DSM 18571]
MSDENTVSRTVRELPGLTRSALSEFFRLEAAGGILLIGAAALALLFANSGLEPVYDSFRQLPVAVAFGEFKIAKPLLLWINDGLMAIFFLLVALEIKREASGGQLSERSQLVLPLACACAGVAVPSGIFWWINRGDPGAIAGWAIPAATDIAFALGILSLLGSRVPVAAKLLLSTIAVVDDLAAISIIAVFYTEDLSVTALVWAGAAITGMVLLNLRGIRALTPYLLLGVLVWVCVLKSGVHATLAGVVTGLLIPHRGEEDGHHSPLERLEHALHPWVAYAILPVFAFANAGLDLRGFGLSDLLSPVPLGIMLGLLLGKPVGVIGAALLVRLAGGRWPEGLDGRSMTGLGLLCGIGFTMSLFIASLAYPGAGNGLAQSSVLGVLVGSVVAALCGWTWLRLTLKDDAP